MNGKGHKKLIDGDSFDGEFINDKLEGYGFYHYADGSFYKG